MLNHEYAAQIKQRRKGRVVEAALMLIFGFVATSALVAFGARAWGDRAVPPAFFAGVGLTGLAIWRILRISVAVDADEIYIRNCFRSYRIPWNDIAAITRADSRAWGHFSFRVPKDTAKTIRLDLQNGATRYVSATFALRADAFSSPDVPILQAFEAQAREHGVKCDDLASTIPADLRYPS